MRKFLLALLITTTPAVADDVIVITVDQSQNTIIVEQPVTPVERTPDVVVLTTRQLSSGETIVTVEDGSDLGKD
jgi:hypothetical protein